MAAKPGLVGQRIKRREDPRLIRGLATYTDDIKLDAMLHAAFVRSQYAAGRIIRVDASKAQARPGVVAVHTLNDLRADVKGSTRWGRRGRVSSGRLARRHVWSVRCSTPSGRSG